MKRRIALCFIVVVAAFAFLVVAAVPQHTVSSQAGVNRDLLGRPIAMLPEKPKRIVAMSPSITEILFALGAGDRIVGVSNYSDYPVAAKNIPTIGAYQSPDMEKVVSLAPDVVFSMGKIQDKSIQVLEQAGIPVVAVEPQNLQEVLQSIDIISQVIGEPEAGARMHQSLEKKWQDVRLAVADKPPVRVFLEVWDSPLLTVGKKSFINDLITQAGGSNVAAVRNVDYTNSDVENLYAYNPDAYLVINHNRTSRREVSAQPEMADLAAVRNGRIYQIDDDLVARPGPRCFTGLAEVAAVLHPEMLESREKE